MGIAGVSRGKYRATGRTYAERHSLGSRSGCQEHFSWGRTPVPSKVGGRGAGEEGLTVEKQGKANSGVTVADLSLQAPFGWGPILRFFYRGDWGALKLR